MTYGDGDLLSRVVRLEQLSGDLSRRVDRLGEQRDLLTEVRVNQGNILKDVQELKDDLEEFQKTTDARERTAMAERRADRKWLVTAIIGSAAVVITTIGIIVSAIT